MHAQGQKTLNKKNNKLITLKIINFSLIAFIAIAVIYLVIQLIPNNPNNQFLQQAPKSQTSGQYNFLTPQELFNNKTFDLQQSVTRRNIFEPNAIGGEALNVAIDTAKLEISQKFRVIGVFVDPVPKAIVQVISTNETVFVKEGEHIEGAMVKKILADGLIITYNNVEFELRR